MSCRTFWSITKILIWSTNCHAYKIPLWVVQTSAFVVGDNIAVLKHYIERIAEEVFPVTAVPYVRKRITCEREPLRQLLS